MISIMLQGTNQKCNQLKAVFGIFLHSCNTPEKVIDALAHMGISISIDAIHDAIRSLSLETYETLRKMGQTLLVAYAYDNFDIDFKTHLPTVEKVHDTLVHLTSGVLIQLEHGVTLDDLRCSEALWKKSYLNPKAKPSEVPPAGTHEDLETLHPESDHPSGLTRRQRYISWKFRPDLFDCGPQYFRKFKEELGKPEWVEKVPVVKMRHVPARAMDVNQSKVSGNIRAIANLLEQGGVGDPDEGMEEDSEYERDVVDMREFVILFHGNLGTFEQVLSVLQQRALEATAYRRYQFIVFLMGLFHLKMACADAIWRIFIEPQASRLDANSLMQFIAQHRPRQTGKIGSDPGFRIMHEVISNVGVALRLDAWCVEAQKCNAQWNSLETFAASEPSLALIEEMADSLAVNYVTGYEANIFKLRGQAAASRDAQHENVLIMHQYFLLYEEITFAMNHGDIGRLETLFPPWIYIFKATGKHKYAVQMTKFLTDVHFVYPEGLKCVHNIDVIACTEASLGEQCGITSW